MSSCESWTIKRQSAKELMPSNCGAGEDVWESLGQQGDQSIQSKGKSTLNTHWKDWCWNWSSSIFVTWCKQPTHWKSPSCWEGLRAEGEEGVRGWDGWMASPMQWTWTWETSRDHERQGGLACCSPWGHKELGMIGHWTATTIWEIIISRKWQPTQVLLPENFLGQRSLVGYSHGHKESDMMEQLSIQYKWWIDVMAF